jgi:hypothetical protein
MVHYVPPTLPVQDVAAQVLFISQNTTSIDTQKAQATTLMRAVRDIVEIKYDIVDPADGRTVYLGNLPSPLFQIKFPNTPDDKISVEANPFITEAIKTTLKQKNAGLVIDGEPSRGLNHEIFLTPTQLETLGKNRDLFIKNVETELENARKPRKQSSAAPTSPEGSTAENVAAFLKLVQNVVQQGRT